MKQFFSGLALFIVFMIAISYEFGYQKVEKVELNMKNQIDEVLAGASLFWDTKQYSEGNIVFNDKEIINLLNKSAVNKYEYELYILDDSELLRFYNNKGFQSSNSITFPYIYINKNKEKISIKRPSIILEASLKKEYFKSQRLYNNKIKRSTMYMVERR